MNATKARRRWIAWCRYVQKTGTQANLSRGWGTDAHDGQARAFDDATFAGRTCPRGARLLYFPSWGNPRG